MGVLHRDRVVERGQFLLSYGFPRLRCPTCGFERLAACSYKGRLCPSCWARRAAAVLQRLPRLHGPNCASAAGHSLHAHTRVGELAREDLRRLVKYVGRPAISARRVTNAPDGRYRVELKTP